MDPQQQSDPLQQNNGVYTPEGQVSPQNNTGVTQPQSPPQPSQTNSAPQQPTPDAGVYSNPGGANKKKILIIAGGVLFLLVLALVALIVTSSGNGPAPTEQKPANSEQEGPQPAQAIDVEQTNNSINQDLSGLNDLTDFPENELDDSSLGL